MVQEMMWKPGLDPQLGDQHFLVFQKAHLSQSFSHIKFPSKMMYSFMSKSNIRIGPCSRRTVQRRFGKDKVGLEHPVQEEEHPGSVPGSSAAHLVCLE